MLRELRWWKAWRDAREAEQRYAAELDEMAAACVAEGDFESDWWEDACSGSPR